MKRFSSALPYSKKWSSGNPEIDRFLEETKSISEGSKLKNSTNIESTLNSSTYLTTNKSLELEKSLKWIPFHEFSNLVEIGRGGFGIVYSAIWHNAPEKRFDLIWNKKRVALKVIFGSNVSTIDLLNEVF
ncbi:5812_t:CDS:1 [Cetraspora pellucida]|uniref:5812_t:CDS:1 n=1 Tax=Cetraspora pellucida TaxID=1433469 RepID=A0ACA9JZ92_9GLOM|nr:5812_t:CDS:1 [Cetraspora pellucida]